MDGKVLIAGAGPTGLAMAAGLEKQGVPFRIIDRAEGPGEESKAMVIHARTLELYDQFGLSPNMIDRGIILDNVAVFNDKRKRARVNLSDIGKGLSPFPFVLSLPQDEHERIIIEYLKERNIEVEWETSLVDFEQKDDKVTAVIEKDGRENTGEYAYLCGCDGPGSTVRKKLGFDFPGGTYEEVFFVADVLSAHAVDGVQAHMFKAGFALVLPVRTSGSTRIIGLIPGEILKQEDDIEYRHLEDYIESHIGVEADEVNWFSTYKVHHRVSEKFRSGAVFISGDAGHVHSPAGGQGMNTGIGDAMNLSWKIAGVLKGELDASVLETYEDERMEFATLLVNTTDEVFKGVVGSGLISESVRNILMPNIIPKAVRFKLWRRLMFRLVSQIHLDYNDSAVSRGRAGKTCAGDRLPWVNDGFNDNYKGLDQVDWHYHLYGQTSSEMRRFIKNTGRRFLEYNWTAEAKHAGIPKNTVMLVRPDGYIAVIDDTRNVERFFEYEMTVLSGDPGAHYLTSGEAGHHL